MRVARADRAHLLDILFFIVMSKVPVAGRVIDDDFPSSKRTHDAFMYTGLIAIPNTRDFCFNFRRTPTKRDV